MLHLISPIVFVATATQGPGTCTESPLFSILRCHSCWRPTTPAQLWSFLLSSPPPCCFRPTNLSNSFRMPCQYCCTYPGVVHSDYMSNPSPFPVCYCITYFFMFLTCGVDLHLLFFSDHLILTICLWNVSSYISSRSVAFQISIPWIRTGTTMILNNLTFLWVENFGKLQIFFNRMNCTMAFPNPLLMSSSQPPADVSMHPR